MAHGARLKKLDNERGLIKQLDAENMVREAGTMISLNQTITLLVIMGLSGLLTEAAVITADGVDPIPSSLEGEDFLSQARALKPPEPRLQYGGESEDNEWWDRHELLIRRAREQWGRKHKELYEGDLDQFIDPDLVRAIESRDKELFAALFKPTDAPSVFTFRLFTREYTELLLDELRYHDESGIPIRRPNGMNRYGAILSELNLSFDSLAEKYLVQAARQLFPQNIGPSDLKQNYAFTVRYQPGDDTSLSEHADASAVTVNVCLHPSSESKVVYFKGHRDKSHLMNDEAEFYVDFAEPGHALIHLGQNVHGVSPISSFRSQLIIWMFGEHGYVRTAPYATDEVSEFARKYGEFWNEGGLDHALGVETEL